MKIAVIGSGISGLVAARRLAGRHDITVFEAGGHVGGHTNTIDVELDGRQHAIDTGFIVFNDWTYPEFIALLDEHGVASQPTAMSFSMRCDVTGLEYCGSSLATLFAQRRNLVSPRFYRMLLDILRFNREAPRDLAAGRADLGLAQYIARAGLGRDFRDQYLLPMGAAIWSTDPDRMLEFPAAYFIRFFVNHGLLNLRDRPEWRVIRGGSRTYVEAFTAGFRDQIRLRSPVERLKRAPDHVEIYTTGAGPERFDAAFVACHSDQALALLERPTDAEQAVLGAIRYQPNTAVLHTDVSMMPRRKRAWAAWNYHRKGAHQRVALTYSMNILQSIDAPTDFCVTLNDENGIDPARILKRIEYAHPVYTPEGVAAQRRHSELHRDGRVFYCGAYWGYGFHEDGVKSALSALADFERCHGDGELSLQRAS